MSFDENNRSEKVRQLAVQLVSELITISPNDTQFTLQIVNEVETSLAALKQSARNILAQHNNLEFVSSSENEESQLSQSSETAAKAIASAGNVNKSVSRDRYLTKQKQFAIIYAADNAARPVDRGDFSDLLGETKLAYNASSLKVMVGRLISEKYLREDKFRAVTPTEEGLAFASRLREKIGERTASDLEQKIREGLKDFDLG